ncbi:hypothetical protein KY290_011165 [Solanum tuberosum]|uniref:Uncharacterized protein n=1 Tax=Solanum tuberosum TaxID=4113 RepID=A0ABQ7W1U9_SOLTU|nr:hypothetical protein KY284_011186 [Solanum tuberosum]KAH0774028.1 hypothetical protein KY290_011165 [Solanum tuberosum]
MADAKLVRTPTAYGSCPVQMLLLKSTSCLSLQAVPRQLIGPWQNVLRYLVGSTDRGLFLRKEFPLTLHAFSDFDWAGDRDDCLSTIAYVVFIGCHAVSWSSKKQQVVACSLT